ncbi:DUF4215 domain-containing protein [Polyangium mundeleinium]|uniref:DUF4215 domain-containing protein n=1 Tax=Polyangium mundeleinium TaxID=2995306 RepID=A0ABT5EHX9_9BACT|nr:DUF4215 domain-containing protein [Polyangium mundeleinium]MDC0740351.1 DUF4215 domain-containing protein [Polyangium mundeleinium]
MNNKSYAGMCLALSLFAACSLVNAPDPVKGSGEGGEGGEGGTGGGVPSPCGNGVYQTGEECDDGNDVETDGCLSTCKQAKCGDGFVWEGVEGCDDGNMVEDDGCTNTCKLSTCGDGTIQEGEDCDDSNMDDTDNCTSACKVATCGDGFVHAGFEACDDGNKDDTDACLQGCIAATCGDGFVQVGVEECDDMNVSNTDGCVGTCKNAVCGDGFVRAGVEACDDGNLLGGDGCGPACTLDNLLPQCMNYAVLSEADRNVNFNDGDLGVEICDSDTLGEGWYRFMGAAGVQMPTFPPPEYACGTDAPGWVQGSYPLNQGEVVNATVCFNWSGNTCEWSSSIQIAHCGGYYVFYLPLTPVCTLRYCGTN